MIKNIDSDVKKILDENRYNNNLKKHANKYNCGNNKIHSSVNSNSDVERYLNFANNTINYYENNFKYKLIRDDIDEMEKALANYESALSKVLQCYDNSYCNFNYSATELQELIDYVDKFEMSIANVWMRKVCQE